MASFGDKVYANFRGLTVPKDDTEHEFCYSYFYWFFTCLQKQILSASIFGQLYL